MTNPNFPKYHLQNSPDLLLSDIGLCHDLNGHLLVSRLVKSGVDLAEGSTTKGKKRGHYYVWLKEK